MRGGNYLIAGRSLTKDELSDIFGDVVKWAIAVTDKDKSDGTGVKPFYVQDGLLYDPVNSVLGYLAVDSDSKNALWVMLYTTGTDSILFELGDAPESMLQSTIGLIVSSAGDHDTTPYTNMLLQTIASEVFDGMSQSELALVMGQYITIGVIPGCACDDPFEVVSYRGTYKNEAQRVLFGFLARVFNANATFTSKRAKVQLESRIKPVFIKVWTEACAKLEAQVDRVMKFSKKASERKETIIRHSVYVHFMSDFRLSYLQGVRRCSLSAATLHYMMNEEMQEILKPLQLSDSEAAVIEEDAKEELGVLGMTSSVVS